MVCLKHEDLSTAKIAERYVAGWVSARGYHGPPGNTRGRDRPIELGILRGAEQTTPVADVFTLTDERNGTPIDNEV